MCSRLGKSLSEILQLSELERAWLLFNVIRDEKEKYEMFSTLLKVIRPELIQDNDSSEITTFETDDQVLKEDLKTAYPDLTEEELDKLVKEIKNGNTPIDSIN